jgi:hypothetical protein
MCAAFSLSIQEMRRPGSNVATPCFSCVATERRSRATIGQALGPERVDVRLAEAKAWFMRGRLREGFAASAAGNNLLLLKRFRAGLPVYESRQELDQPPWRGEVPVAGKTILLQCDGGLGDVIQYARYVPLLSAQGARIVAAAPRELRRLFSDMECVTAIGLAVRGGPRSGGGGTTGSNPRGARATPRGNYRTDSHGEVREEREEREAEFIEERLTAEFEEGLDEQVDAELERVLEEQDA